MSVSPDPESMERANLVSLLGMSIDDPNLSLSDLRSMANHPNGPETAGLKEADTITSSRPSAVTAGAGTELYDTTLSKPIWSDGAVWRDAMGTAV